jgi:hypothetical protein
MEGTYILASPPCASPSFHIQKGNGNGGGELAKEDMAIHPRNTRFSSQK